MMTLDASGETGTLLAGTEPLCHRGTSNRVRDGRQCSPARRT